MSTGYGHFTSRDGKRVYADASQVAGVISLCGAHDSDIYFEMNEAQADKLMTAMLLAYQHNGWELPDFIEEKQR
jgi:hypothetical protein